MRWLRSLRTISGIHPSMMMRCVGCISIGSSIIAARQGGHFCVIKRGAIVATPKSPLLRYFPHDPVEEVIVEGNVDLFVQTTEVEIRDPIALI